LKNQIFDIVKGSRKGVFRAQGIAGIQDGVVGVLGNQAAIVVVRTMERENKSTHVPIQNHWARLFAWSRSINIDFDVPSIIARFELVCLIRLRLGLPAQQEKEPDEEGNEL
jgi:hypothetical protein